MESGGCCYWKLIDLELPQHTQWKNLVLVEKTPVATTLGRGDEKCRLLESSWRYMSSCWTQFIIIAPTPHPHALAGSTLAPYTWLPVNSLPPCLCQVNLLRPSTKVICFTDKFWVPHTGLVDCPSNLNWHLNFHRYAKISSFFFFNFKEIYLKTVW